VVLANEWINYYGGGDNDDGEDAAEEVAAEEVKWRKSFKTIPEIAEILLAFEDLASVHHRSVLFRGAHVLLPTFQRDSKFADFKGHRHFFKLYASVSA